MRTPPNIRLRRHKTVHKSLRINRIRTWSVDGAQDKLDLLVGVIGFLEDKEKPAAQVLDVTCSDIWHLDLDTLDAAVGHLANAISLNTPRDGAISHEQSFPCKA